VQWLGQTTIGSRVNRLVVGVTSDKPPLIQNPDARKKIFILLREWVFWLHKKNKALSRSGHS